MPTQFYYAREGKQFGPVSAEQLKQVAASGWLRAHDTVWAQGFPNWVPASKIKELFPSAPTPDSIAPAPVPPAAIAIPVASGKPELAAAPVRPVRGGIVAGAGAAALVVVIGVCWLVISLTRPSGDSRLAEAKDDKKGSTEKEVPEKEPKEDPEKKVPPKEDPEKKELPPKEKPRTENAEAGRALQRGNAAMDKGDYALAIREYTQAIELRPGWARAYCNRGQAHMNSKDYPKAIADCDEALKIDPKLMDAHAFRAASLFDAGDHDEAIRSADQALKIDEKASFFYYLRGAGYFHKNSLDRSIEDLSQAIRLDGKNAQFYNFRGLAYEKNGEMAKANADFGRRDALLGKTAEGSDAKRLAKQRMDEAEAAYLQAQALNNADDARYVQERNMALAQNGRRRAMGLPLVVVRPADPQLAQRAQAARQVYLEARRIYEQTQ